MFRRNTLLSEDVFRFTPSPALALVCDLAFSHLNLQNCYPHCCHQPLDKDVLATLGLTELAEAGLLRSVRDETPNAPASVQVR